MHRIRQQQQCILDTGAKELWWWPLWQPEVIFFVGDRVPLWNSGWPSNSQWSFYPSLWVLELQTCATTPNKQVKMPGIGHGASYMQSMCSTTEPHSPSHHPFFETRSKSFRRGLAQLPKELSTGMSQPEQSARIKHSAAKMKQRQLICKEKTRQ